MCEWLSCEEWCDVFLLCGGRVFSAHRAVLASVSKFLRKILLSCPIDETPTFIVMPEFDFETMSCALHYIYNGEVAIRTHQVNTFLDIMNALQVFVDTRDLKKHLKINKYVFIENDYTYKKENIHSTAKNYVTLKREVTKNANIKLPFDNVNSDNNKLSSNFYKTKEIRLGYLKSLKDRQSQSFSRDLFIETYSLNRNGNGVTEGVLAISNERYREPGSLLEKNANTNHLREVHTETTHKKGSRDNLNSLYANERFETRSKENVKSFVGICLKNKTNVEKISENNFCNNIQGGGEKNLENSISKEVETSINCTLISRHTLNLDTKKPENGLSEKSSELNKSKEAISRVTILNEVLQSPWRPRLSLTFTPYPKKCINWKLDKEKSVKFNQNGAPIDDKNNNNNETTKTENNDNEDTSNIKEMKLNVSKDATEENKDEHLTGHKSTRYTCTECHKSFSQLRNYKYHMSVHRGTKEFATTCPVCGKFFNDKGYLSSHMKIHRNRKEYKCTMCPKSFNQRVAYNMHMRIHTGVKPHVCDECGKAFSRKMLLKQHQRTHSGERPYACQHCNKRFADRSNMTLHLRLHTGVKPFACTLCPKSFTKKHHLKSHLNFHTGDKPYTCPRCKLAFTQSSNMRTHMKKCNVNKD